MADLTANIPSAYLQGIGVPALYAHPDHYWTVQSSVTQAGPRPGSVVAQQETGLVLESTGEQAAGIDMRVRVQRAGNPQRDNGAGILWRIGASGDWYGWEPPRAISGWEAVVWTTDAPGTLDPCVVRLAGADVAVCVYQRTVSGTRRVYVRTKTPDAAWSSAVLLYTAPAALSKNLRPFALALPDGSVLAGHLVYSADENEAQVQIHRSTDEGATWITASVYALQATIDTSGSPGAGAAGYAVTRLRACAAGGVVVLIAAVLANNTSLTYRDTYLQYASVSEGLRYDLIESGDDFDEHYLGYPEVVSDDGLTFKVIFAGGATTAGGSPDADQVYLRTLESAYQSLNAAWGAGDVAVLSVLTYTASSGSPTVFTDGDCAAWVDEDGFIYVAARTFSGGAAQGYAVISRSSDGGQTWEGMGESALSATRVGQWYRGDTGAYPVRLTGCALAGQALILHNWAAAVADEDNSLGCFYLGGWTQLVLPRQDLFELDTRRAGWEFVFPPIEVPGDISGVTVTSSGGFTDVVDAGTDGKGSNSVTVTGQHFNDVNFLGDPEEGVIGEFAILVNSGGDITTNEVAVHVRLADGTDDIDVIFRFERSGDDIVWRVVDANAATQIGLDQTHDASADVALHIRYGLAKNTGASSGSFACWFSDWQPGQTARAWQDGPSSTSLTDDTATPAADNVIEWGAIVSGGSSDFEWKWFAWQSDSYIGPVGWAAGQSNPDDLFPRPLTGRACYLNGGLKVRGLAGPGSREDEFRIQTRYDYEIERVHPVVDPSPRRAWRSTGSDRAVQVAQQEIAWRVDTTLSADADSQPLSPVLAIYLGGVNFRTGELFGYESGTGWVSLGAFDLSSGLSSLDWTRVGATLQPGGTSDNLYLHPNEFAGGHFSLASGIQRRILRHGGGRWSTAAQRPILHLENVVGADTASGSTGAIVPPQAVLLYHHTSGETYAGYKLRIDAQYTPDGYVRAGIVAPCEVSVTTPGPSHGWQRARRAFAERHTAPDGTTRSRARPLRPSGRSFSVGWPEPLFEGAAHRTGSPDTVRAYTGSGGLAVASWGAAARTAEGVLSMLDQRDSPVLYIHRLPVVASGQLSVLNRSEDFLWGWLGDQVSVTNTYEVPGDDTTRISTIATLTLTEQT